MLPLAFLVAGSAGSHPSAHLWKSSRNTSQVQKGTEQCGRNHAGEQGLCRQGCVLAQPGQVEGSGYRVSGRLLGTEAGCLCSACSVRGLFDAQLGPQGSSFSFVLEAPPPCPALLSASCLTSKMSAPPSVPIHLTPASPPSKKDRLSQSQQTGPRDPPQPVSQNNPNEGADVMTFRRLS